MAWLNSCLAPWRITSVRTSPLVGSGTIRVSFVENSMVAYSFGLVGQLGKNSDTFSQSTPPFSFDYPQLLAIAQSGSHRAALTPWLLRNPSPLVRTFAACHGL